MIEVPVRNVQGAVVGTIALDASVWGIEPHRAVLHQAVVAQLANARAGTAKTLTRGEVSGGGRKPWRQKGTGRARQGSIRAPHWRGGGVVFGPTGRVYRQALPRKMRRLAMRSALSSKVAANELVVVDKLTLPEPRTKEMVRVLSNLGVGQNALVVLETRDEGVRRAAANLPRVRVVTVGGMNLLDVLKYNYLVVSQGAVDQITRTLKVEPKVATGEAA